MAQRAPNRHPQPPMTDHQDHAAVGTHDEDLPTFARPPVNEVALSVQFGPIADFGPYPGVYWAGNRSLFERAEILPPLASVTEELGKPVARARLGVKFSTDPDARFWLLRAGGTQLVQIQSDRFVFNWRQVDGTEIYPRYPAIRDLFEQEWDRFCAFLRAEKLASPEVNQCEVTYVNHIDYDAGWSGYGELSRVIEPWCGRSSGNFLPAPERASVEAHYRLPDDRGRLHVSVEPVVRGRDSQEVLQITLTARGAPASGSMGDLLEWMDLGRRWVVNGFVDFTTQQMHNRWGLKS